MTEKVARPIAEVLPVAQRLVEALAPGAHRIELAGSLRRKKAIVKDIELVAIPRIAVLQGEKPADMFGGAGEAPTTRVNLLWGLLDNLLGGPDSEAYAKRGDKYRQFTFEETQVDLFTATQDNWGWIFLVRTGSADFSHGVAASLNRFGMTSEEGQIIHKYNRRPISTPTEDDVFKLIHEPFIEPERRSL